MTVITIGIKVVNNILTPETLEAHLGSKLWRYAAEVAVVVSVVVNAHEEPKPATIAVNVTRHCHLGVCRQHHGVRRPTSLHGEVCSVNDWRYSARKNFIK